MKQSDDANYFDSHWSWEDDKMANKSDFLKESPDLKHPSKLISGWRKSLLAQEEKKMRREISSKKKIDN